MFSALKIGQFYCIRKRGGCWCQVIAPGTGGVVIATTLQTDCDRAVIVKLIALYMKKALLMVA